MATFSASTAGFSPLQCQSPQRAIRKVETENEQKQNQNVKNL